MKNRVLVFISCFLLAVLSSCGEVSRNTPSLIDNSPSAPELAESPPPSSVNFPIDYPKMEKTLVWALPGFNIPCSDAEWLTAFNLALIEKGADFNVEFLPVGALNDGYDNPDDNGLWYIDLVEQIAEKNTQIDLLYAGSMNGSGHVLDWYMRAYQAGLTTPLDDMLNTETGQLVLGSFPPIIWENMRINGEIHGFYDGIMVGTHRGYLLSKEWLSANPIDTGTLTYELDSLVNLLRGVTDAANFDGDNVNYDGLIMSLSTTLGLPLVAPGVILSGDSAVPLFETIKVEEHLRSARELFELGHIAPYKLIDKPESYIIYGYGDAEGVFPAEEAYISVPVTPPVIQAPVNALCIASSSEYKEECIQLLSWLYTDPDLTNILLYGLEGLHYGKENESVYIINEDSRGNYFMSPIYSCFHTRASLTSEFSPFYANGVFTRAAEYMEKLTPQANTGFHFDSRGWEDIVLRMDELLFSELTFHYREDNRGTIRTHLFLTGEDPDWEVKLAQLNKTLADAGIHELAAEVDRQYQEWKALYSPVR